MPFRAALSVRTKGAEPSVVLANLLRNQAKSSTVRAMRSPLLAPRHKAVRVQCDVCFGTGKQAAEWDFQSGAVVAYKVCGSCLGRGAVLTNVRQEEPCLV
jgi:formate dehydrogenase maturation protein FdhE